MPPDKITGRQRDLFIAFSQEIQRVFPDINDISLKGLMRSTVELYERQSETKVIDLESIEDLETRLKEVKKMGDIFSGLLIDNFGLDASKVAKSVLYVYARYRKSFSKEN